MCEGRPFFTSTREGTADRRVWKLWAAEAAFIKDSDAFGLQNYFGKWRKQVGENKDGQI